MQADFPPSADGDITPEEWRMRRSLSLWLCRLLTIPKMKEKFIKQGGFCDTDVSQFLGLSDEDEKLAGGSYTPELASAGRTTGEPLPPPRHRPAIHP